MYVTYKAHHPCSGSSIWIIVLFYELDAMILTITSSSVAPLLLPPRTKRRLRPQCTKKGGGVNNNQKYDQVCVEREKLSSPSVLIACLAFR